MATLTSNTLYPPQAPPPTRLIPVTAWNQYHAWPPLGGLRHLIFNGHANGFGSVVRRVGGRVLVDEAAFFQWVEEASHA